MVSFPAFQLRSTFQSLLDLPCLLLPLPNPHRLILLNTTPPSPLPLQFMLRLHQPLLHPPSELIIMLDRIAVEQRRQREFDLVVEVEQIWRAGSGPQCDGKLGNGR